jgi:hypothetical protein
MTDTTSGSSAVPPGDAAEVGREGRDVGDALLQQVAEAAAVLAERLGRRRRCTYCERTTTPTVGWACRMRSAATSPSSVWGGIRISVIARSGTWRATSLELGGSADGGDDVESVAGEDVQALTQQHFILRDDYAHGSSTLTVVPLPAGEATSIAPPNVHSIDQPAEPSRDPAAHHRSRRR